MKKNQIQGLITQNKRLIENFSYVTLLQVFMLAAPLITYPYLVGVLGKELYGLIITAQVLASYGTIIINFGTDSVCAKHVSIHRDNSQKLAVIFSNILAARGVLWCFCLLLFVIVVLIVPEYRNYFLLFVLTYGITFHEWLFPQYFFQGLESMKVSTLIDLSIKLFFIALVFFVVRDKEGYLYVPLLYTTGHFLGGIFSLWYIIKILGIKLVKPTINEMMFYLKESSPLFATDIICTIKDKFNYFIIGNASMGNVVIYDLGVKLTGILAKPTTIISTVLFPRFAKSRNTKVFKKVLFLVIFMTIALVLLANVFLPQVVFFFLHEEIDMFPLRIFTLAPIFLVVSSFIYHNLIIAFGYNKYALYSILVTTFGYLILLSILFLTHQTHSLLSFIYLAVCCYLIELLYRIAIGIKIVKIENNKG